MHKRSQLRPLQSMMLSWDQEVLVQGWSDGSEATPEHMGESTLRATRGLIDLSHPRHADAGCEEGRGEICRHCAWRTIHLP
jgi:hypothetical protein